MRLQKDRQGRFDFQRSTLRITNEFYERYSAISETLERSPRVLALLNRDIGGALDREARARRRRGRPCEYTSENVLRILVCQVVEGLALREVAVRIDDSWALRQFVRIHDGPMMDFTTLCRLKNAIKPATWKKINQALAKSAVEAELIDGEQLRLDTTLVETNIRWPSDSGLLWDICRVIARLIRKARKIDPAVAADARLQDKRAKKLLVAVARETGKRKIREHRLQRLYGALIRQAEAFLETAGAAVAQLAEAVAGKRLGLLESVLAEEIAKQLKHFSALGQRVVDQARRRVLQGEQVPATEKLYSIFEPHTELIKRGKAGKPVEFGHMVALDQVGSKFITGYEVFDRRPTEHQLVEPAVRAHSKLFGRPPSQVSADKGYHSRATLERVADDVETVAIGNPKRSGDDNDAGSMDALFRIAQAFRAGIEGTISFLKRAFRMFRCFDKGWEHFASAIGRIIFGHNLVVLARASRST
jgi:IS5 family transposase